MIGAASAQTRIFQNHRKFFFPHHLPEQMGQRERYREICVSFFRFIFRIFIYQKIGKFFFSVGISLVMLRFVYLKMSELNRMHVVVSNKLLYTEGIKNKKKKLGHRRMRNII